MGDALSSPEKQPFFDRANFYDNFECSDINVIFSKMVRWSRLDFNPRKDFPRS